MKRLFFLGAVLPFFYVLGFVLVLVELYMNYMYIGPTSFKAAAVHAACWMVPLPLAFLAVNRITRHGVRAREAVAVALVCFAAAFVGAGLFGWIVVQNHWYMPRDARKYVIDRPLPSAIRIAGTGVQGPIVIAAAMLVSAAFLSTRREERDRELRASHIETRLADARVQLLRSQLNPHFLFNALNSVAALVRHDPAQAGAMLERLSRFYRIASQTEGRQLVSVAEEVGFARQYLEIERVRFGGRLSVEIDVDRAAAEALVPALILQPLVENAVKHGIACTVGPGRVRIVARRDDGLYITVENNGAFDPTHEGVGLANTRERLRHLYGDGHALRIASWRGGTLVELRIPA